jgi:DNA-binding CsgD family transcriptional regulator
MDVKSAVLALEAGAWNPEAARSAFDAAAHHLNTRIFHVSNITRPEIAIIGSTLSHEACEDYLHRRVYEFDTWTLKAKQARREDYVPIFDSDLVADDERRRDVYFQDWCPIWGVGAHVAWTVQHSDEMLSFCIMRDTKKGQFSQSERRSLAQFAKLSRQIAVIMTTVRDIGDRAFANGLDASGRNFVLLDHRGRVCHVAPATHKIFDDEFGVRSDALWASEPHANQQLRHLAAVAQNPARGAGASEIPVPRSGKRPLVLTPIPVNREGLFVLPGARMIVLISDLAAQALPNPRVLREAFELSDGEASVAIALLSGKSATEIAASLGLRVSTVRQTIKSLLAKTNTHRQAELVSLLSRLSHFPSSKA